MTDPAAPQDPAASQPVPPPPAAAPVPPPPAAAPATPPAPAAAPVPPPAPAAGTVPPPPGGTVPPSAAPAAPAPPLTEAEDKQWASFAHFGGVLGFLPALIIFLVFKDRGAKTRVEAKEALNWQITWVAAAIILSIVFAIINTIMWSVLPYSAWGFYYLVAGLFAFINWLPYLANIVFSIIGGVKVNGGGSYRSPFAIRLIK
jgi:uncharacterized protein